MATLLGVARGRRPGDRGAGKQAYLINYVLLTYQLLGVKKLAFWGHGKNLQARGERRISEFVKRLVSRRVHWWFAYNNLSAEIVKKTGFPEDRITVAQNA